MENAIDNNLISFFTELFKSVLNFGYGIWEVLMYEINIGIYDGPLIGMVLGSSFVTVFLAWIVITVIDILA